MVDYKNIISPGTNETQKVQLTAEEQAELDSRRADWITKRPDRKLKEIKKMRLQRLQDTDWMSNSDVTMPENIKTWRQELRDLPQTYTTEAGYDELLATTKPDPDNQAREVLTHAIWTKP